MLENCHSLKETEALLRQMLSPSTFLGQYPFTEADVTLLGKLFSEQLAYSESFTRRLGHSAPLSFLCFMVWVGVLDYRSGDYWNGVASRIPTWRTEHQDVWGDTFLELLHQEGFQEVSSEDALRFVTPILAQGMIPNHCISDFCTNVLMPLMRCLQNPTDQLEILIELHLRRDWFQQRSAVEAERNQIARNLVPLRGELRQISQISTFHEPLHELRKLEQDLEADARSKTVPVDIASRLSVLENDIGQAQAQVDALSVEQQHLQIVVESTSSFDDNLISMSAEIQAAEELLSSLENEALALSALAAEIELQTERITKEAEDLLQVAWTEDTGNQMLLLEPERLRQQHASAIVVAQEMQQALHAAAAAEEEERVSRRGLSGTLIVAVGTLVSGILGAGIGMLFKEPILIILGLCITAVSCLVGGRSTRRRRLLMRRRVTTRQKGELLNRSYDFHCSVLRSKLPELPIPASELLYSDVVEAVITLRTLWASLQQERKGLQERRGLLESKEESIQTLARRAKLANMDSPRRLVIALQAQNRLALQKRKLSQEAAERLMDQVGPALSLAQENLRKREHEQNHLIILATELGDGSLDHGLARHRQWLENLERITALRNQLDGQLPGWESLHRDITTDALRGRQAELQRQITRYKTRARELRTQLAEMPAVYPTADKPVSRFLLHGGEVADRLVIAAVAFAHAVVSDTDEPEDADRHLPERIQTAFLDWWDKQSDTTGQQPILENEKSSLNLSPPFLCFQSQTLELRATMPKNTLPAWHLNGQPLIFELLSENDSTPLGSRSIRVVKLLDNRVETSAAEVTIPAPLPAYRCVIKQGSMTMAEWILTGLSAQNPLMAFTPQRGLNRATQLNRRTRWVVMGHGCGISHHPGTVVEYDDLSGLWAGYAYAQVDLRETTNLDLICADGTPESLPVQTAEAGVDLVGGMLMANITSNGLPVYSDSPPVLKITLGVRRRLRHWRLSIWAEPGSQPGKPQHFSLVSFVPENHSGAEVILSLSDGRLLGHTPTGQFRVRVRGPSGIEEDFAFVVSPPVRIAPKDGRKLYLPQRPKENEFLRLVVDSAAGSRFHPEPPASIEGNVIIANPGTVILRGSLNLALDQELRIPLEMELPWVQWRITGMPDGTFESWQTTVEEIGLRHLEAGKSLNLHLRLPLERHQRLRLTLQGTDQHHEVVVRKREALFGLNRFADSLRDPSAPPLRTFVIQSDGAGEPDDVILFRVRTRWEVINLKVERVVKHGKLVLTPQWSELGDIGDRVVRLWHVDTPDLPLVEERVQKGVCEAIMSLDITELPTGKYLLEIAQDDPWSGTAAAMPDTNAPNIARFDSDWRLSHREHDLDIVGVEDPRLRQTYGLLNIQYVITPYPLQPGLLPNQQMGRLAIMPRKGDNLQIQWEDPVLYEYDPHNGVLTLLLDKYGDGACFCSRCRRLYWSLDDEAVERSQGHFQSLCVPEILSVRKRR